MQIACFLTVTLMTTSLAFAQQPLTEKSTPNRRTSKITTKPTVLKNTPPPKGEGYWVESTPPPVIDATPPPPTKVYTEIQTSVTEDGQLFLTSDTVIVRPEVKAKTVTVPVVAPIESTGDNRLDNIIQTAAQKHQIDPRLILEVVRQESGFRLRAVSHKGAQGLMQLMPATAARFGVVNSYDPAENVNAGTKYLRFLLDTFNGDLELALAGYNAGENAVIRNNYKIPNYRETRDYVRSITARYRSKFHQVTTTVAKKPEPPKIQRVPVMTLTAEDGRAVLSNNY
jgi:hypothetical protein